MTDQNPGPVIPDLDQAAKERQSLLLAIIGGSGGMVLTAGLWALVYALTGVHTFLFAFLTGIIVSVCVRALGRGCTPVYGLVGAIFALAATLIAYVIVAQVHQATSLQTPWLKHLMSQSPVDWFQTYFQAYLVPRHGFAYILAGLLGYSGAFRRLD